MDKQNEIHNGKIKVLRFVFSAVLKALKEVADVFSVAACFWILSWLLYFAVVKDFFDIILYAIQKYTERFRWFCRITGIGNLFKDITSDFEEKTEIPKIIFDKVDCETSDEVFENSPAVISVTRTGNDSCQAPELLPQGTPRIPANKLASPRCIINPNSDNCKKDVAYVSPVQQQSYFRQKIFRWSLRASDSLQNERLPLLSSPKCKKIWRVEDRAKEMLPIPCEDKEKLIKADESPEYIGCCGNIFTLMKNMLVMNKTEESSMHYKRF